MTTTTVVLLLNALAQLAASIARLIMALRRW